MFYNPSTENGRAVLTFARELSEQHRGLGVLAMAVSDDAEAVRKQHAEMKLPFPILDGRGLHHTFGVKDTPRLVLLDAEGIVRGAYTGWGSQTPAEVIEELQRWLRK
jgi:hypothetical protein